MSLAILPVYFLNEQNVPLKSTLRAGIDMSTESSID